jgi:dTDP-4-amino-4,6-dideoxygalactose transaminase
VVRLQEPHLGSDVEELVVSVIRSGQIAQGPMVERFEHMCAAMAGTREAVAVSNGTVSLEASLEVLGVGPGDEVITSPLTFAATLNAILRSGATARFAEIDESYCIRPDSVEALVGPLTSVVLPVHLYGQPADMTAISALAARHGLAVLEDAAQAHGASVAGRPVGSYGLGSFSFYATKNVTTGEGGVVTTSDHAQARALRLLRNQGMAKPYEYEIVGANLRMTDLQAALAIPQLGRLEQIGLARNRNAAHLSRRLADLVPALGLPNVPPDNRHAWHLYTVLLPPDADRTAVMARMREGGVHVNAYYPALVWDHPPYRVSRQVRRDDTPFAALVASRCLSLPVHPGLEASDLDRIVAALDEALR